MMKRRRYVVALIPLLLICGTLCRSPFLAAMEVDPLARPAAVPVEQGR
ncbi:hypothetical protein [Desulfogranum mediterraneum]|nr:hypothetical protein [Desulfogranum mediterraneum]